MESVEKVSDVFVSVQVALNEYMVMEVTSCWASSHCLVLLKKIYNNISLPVPVNHKPCHFKAILYSDRFYDQPVGIIHLPLPVCWL